MPTNFKPKDPTNPFADYSEQDALDFLSSYELTRDIGPKAPVHVLVIPRAHHEDVAALAEADPALAGELLAAAAAVAKAEGLRGPGFRVIFNAGEHGGQEVFHVHAHVVGGAPLGPMLAS